MINIIGGKFKRKKIDVPKQEVRPTSSIKREAIFSILESLAAKNSIKLYEGKCFIDLFAGSGSLGLEAISRGASFSYFYESNTSVVKILKNNCIKICQKNEFKIILHDITLIDKFDLNFPLSVIFIDPPYKFLFINSILDIIIKNNILTKNTFIVIEGSKNNKLTISNKFEILQQKIYGKTKLLFLKKSS